MGKRSRVGRHLGGREDCGCYTCIVRILGAVASASGSAYVNERIFKLPE